MVRTLRHSHQQTEVIFVGRNQWEFCDQIRIPHVACFWIAPGVVLAPSQETEGKELQWMEKCGCSTFFTHLTLISLRLKRANICRPIFSVSHASTTNNDYCWLNSGEGGFGDRHSVNRSVSGSCTDEIYLSFVIVYFCIHSREMVYISMQNLALNEIVQSLKDPLKSRGGINSSIDQSQWIQLWHEPKDIPLIPQIEGPIIHLKYWVTEWGNS